MLYLLFSGIIILPVLIGWGSFFQKIAGDFFKGIASKLLMGVFSLTLIWTLIAFFFPINSFVEIGCIVLGLAFFFLMKNQKECWLFLKENKLLFPIASLIILFCGTFYPFILDHFGYYVPTIKWLTEFGIVKGISNLDIILGQMSFWHIFQSGFSHFSDPYLRINVVALLIYLIYILEKKSWTHLLFFPILFFYIQSPSPDLPTIAFSLIVLNEILKGNTNATLLFAFSIFIFAIKPTLLWLPILSFMYAIFIVKSKWTFLIGGILILGLYFFKNSWTFGYPIFPVQVFDLGLSWKPNAELLKNSAELAIEKTYDLQYTYQEIRQFSTWDYINNWFLLDGIKAKIHIAFILSLLFFSFFSWYKKSKVITYICIAILIKSLFVVLFSAQYRFFVEVFFVIFFVVFYQKINKKIALPLFVLGSISMAILLTFPKYIQQQAPSFRLGFFMGELQNNQWLKPAVYDYSKFKTYKVGNFEFNAVQDYPFSFDTPIPAISPEFLRDYYEANIFPEPNSKNIKHGFHWKKLTPNEKIQLKNVLDDLKVSSKKN